MTIEISQRQSSPSRWPWLALALLLLGVDQVIKFAVVNTMQEFDSHAIFTGFNWVYVLNPGAAFSFLADAGGWQRYFFAVFAVSVSVFLARMLWLGVARKLEALSYALLMSGALGNAADRVRLGAVVDYLDFYWKAWHWPAFNFADICVVTAALLMILKASRQNKPTNPSTMHNHAP